MDLLFELNEIVIKFTLDPSKRDNLKAAGSYEFTQQLLKRAAKHRLLAGHFTTFPPSINTAFRKTVPRHSISVGTNALFQRAHAIGRGTRPPVPEAAAAKKLHGKTG